MNTKLKHQIQYYVIALLICFLTFLVKKYLIDDITKSAPFLLMVLAPIISAIIGGIGPGIFSVIVTTILLDYFFLPPYNTFILNYNTVFQLMLYVLQGLFIVWLIERQRKATEKYSRLAAIVESSDDAIYGKTFAGVITSWNKGAEKMYGYSPEEIIGKKVDVLTPKERKKEVQKILNQLSLGGKVDHYETQRMRKDGKKIDISISISPVRNSVGELIGASTIARDITERKRLDAELKRANAFLEKRVEERTKELSRSNRELQDFAYVASHDLQEPLRKIQSFGNLLYDEEKDHISPDGNAYLNRMLDAAGRMRVLIEDLLTFSRVTTKAQPFEKINLNKIIDEVISDLETSIADVKGKVRVEKLPEIEADPLQMRQLFQNLLTNALKFHKKNVPPEIKIAIDKNTNTGKINTRYNTITIVVSDNGIGFEQQYADQIFTIFERLHGRSEYKGTGIGLAVVRKIVERHKGHVTATSKLSEGATFSITLPLRQGGES